MLPSYRSELDLNLYNQLDYYLRYNAGSTYEEPWERESQPMAVRASYSCYSRNLKENQICDNNIDADEDLFFSVEKDLNVSLKKQSSDICVAEENFSTEVASLLTEFQRIAVELRKRGVWEMVVNRMFHPTHQLSRVLIRNNRIYLPDYNNLEIKMTPMAKSVYFLFLRHPEGIVFKDLPDYRNELRDIYNSLSCFDDKNRMEKSIEDVTNPMKNSINENASRIRKAFVEQFDDSLAQNYYITGGRGEAKKITLPRQLVTWENYLLK